MGLSLHVINQPIVLHVDLRVFSKFLCVIDDFLKVLKVLFLEKEIISGNDFAFAVMKPFDFPTLLLLDVVDDSALFPLKVALKILPFAVADHKVLFQFILLNKILWLVIIDHVVLNGKEIRLGFG